MENLFSGPRFGKYVRDEIRKRRLTQERTAQILEIDKSSLSRVVNGYMPNVEDYLRLLQWLVPNKFETMYEKQEGLK